MGWLLRPVTGAPLVARGPDSSRVHSVCLVLLSNCYIIIYCIVWFQVQPFQFGSIHILLLLTVASEYI